FAVNRPLTGANRDILVTITPATITGTALTGFRDAAGAALPTNFGTGATLVGGTIIAVPEPTSIALVALVGGIGAGARLRTRKAKKKSVALEA
ncbi:MAG TPA: PEP-CTERM sorting domain-containing protein, partial [Pirellula sp.]|nr:PEP-CTERM sorting domain-containing protein [Pirellula sp.]